MAASAGCGAGRLCFLHTDRSPWTAQATVLNEYFCRSQNLLSTHFKVFSWTLAMSDAALLLLNVITIPKIPVELLVEETIEATLALAKRTLTLVHKAAMTPTPTKTPLPDDLKQCQAALISAREAISELRRERDAYKAAMDEIRRLASAVALK